MILGSAAPVTEDISERDNGNAWFELQGILQYPKQSSTSTNTNIRHIEVYSIVNRLVMGWLRHVARMVNRSGHKVLWWKTIRERTHWEGLGVDGRIILKLIFMK